jgi:hypothetical protein
VPTIPVAEAREIGIVSPPQQPVPSKQISTAINPQWQGKELQVAIGATVKTGEHMTIAFSVRNNSSSPIELLPPQVQLSGAAHERHGSKTIADQVAISDYQLTTRELLPGKIAEGVVVFDRPTFKESGETLLLQVARADQVDRPVLVPIAFVAQNEGRGL